ncbi:RNA methyltransferase [Vibrio methylphosphonaticus]|uniref:RNA methyltransferase n=1 Tax=Vibrio methylphosphonaticus TaxID=2946866 RepID=UPI00202A8EDC|nr:RNA methyltransferase [Vibrio methylphosphonaticus]MCL9774091.1 RNA methyltransferase [Vibrio methylphosphonaticus]
MANDKSVIIGLVNPKSPTNVGAVMRAAGCYQASEVRYSGERFDKAAKFQTDTQNINKTIPLVGTEDLLGTLPEEMKIVCVELVVGATPLPDFVHPEKAIYIFGPEDNSIPKKIVKQADEVVYVPTIGCMNLAATTNVLLYDRLAKSVQEINHDELIKSSRDKNNHLKI